MNRKKLIKYFIEALIVTILFFIIEWTQNIEIVRKQITDFAFSTMNALYFSKVKSAEDSSLKTNIVVYTVDKGYFKDKNLLNDSGETNYGYVFPRSKLAEMIDVIDKLPSEKRPLALFLDYDFEFGSASFEQNQSPFHLSKDDLVFLQKLATFKEDYYILIPTRIDSNNILNYFASLENNDFSEKLKNKIKNNKIIFVNVDFLNDNCTVYRYNPIQHYKSESRYNVALVGWQLRKNSGIIKESEILSHFDRVVFSDYKKLLHHGKAVIKSNILYKEWEYGNIDEYTNEKESRWQGLKSYSAYILCNSKNLSFDKHTIVMIGVDFQQRDRHITPLQSIFYNTIPQMPDDYHLKTSSKPGIIIHAEALKTVLFLDGDLKNLPWYWSLLILFIVIFAINGIIESIEAFFLSGNGSKYIPLSVKNNKNLIFSLKIVLKIIFYGISLLLISGLLIQYKHQWFNWGVAWILWLIDDIYEYIEEKINELL